jgi:hypothetical protein
MSLAELQRIKQWHLRHRSDHPVENHLWDMMLTLWLAGWVGWIPAFAFDALWAAPVLAIAMSAPALYAGWRLRAHRARRLRCDWMR